MARLNEFESRDERKTNFYASESSISWNEYAQLRPRYSNTIYETIARYMKQHNGTERKLCIDYGSGTGVAVSPILDKLGITKVIGMDLNARQLEEGEIQLRQHYGVERFETMVGAAGELHNIRDNSIDLITAAEAAHWFPMSSWLAEVARVLRPSGTLAVWFYRPQCFILSHPAAAPACNHIFEKFFELAIPKGALGLDQILFSVTLLDSLVLEPDALCEQERYKWHIPGTIAEQVPKAAELRATDLRYTETQTRAGLLTTPPAKVKTVVPQTSGETLLRAQDWTTKTLVRYLHTVGPPIDELLSDESFQQSLQKIEATVGGPEGMFDVGWEIALLLATKR